VASVVRLRLNRSCSYAAETRSRNGPPTSSSRIPAGGGTPCRRSTHTSPPAVGTPRKEASADLLSCTSTRYAAGRRVRRRIPRESTNGCARAASGVERRVRTPSDASLAGRTMMWTGAGSCCSASTTCRSRGPAGASWIWRPLRGLHGALDRLRHDARAPGRPCLFLIDLEIADTAPAR